MREKREKVKTEATEISEKAKKIGEEFDRLSGGSGIESWLEDSMLQEAKKELQGLESKREELKKNKECMLRASMYFTHLLDKELLPADTILDAVPAHLDKHLPVLGEELDDDLTQEQRNDGLVALQAVLNLKLLRERQILSDKDMKEIKSAALASKLHDLTANLNLEMKKTEVRIEELASKLQGFLESKKSPRK